MLRPADHIAEDQSDRVHSDYDVQPQQLWREDVASAADTEAVTPGRDRCGSLNEPDEIAFADWLADALRREDMTMEEAALQIGVSVKTFSRWVGGITEPDFATCADSGISSATSHSHDHLRYPNAPRRELRLGYRRYDS